MPLHGVYGDVPSTHDSRIVYKLSKSKSICTAQNVHMHGLCTAGCTHCVTVRSCRNVCTGAISMALPKSVHNLFKLNRLILSKTFYPFYGGIIATLRCVELWWYRK